MSSVIRQIIERVIATMPQIVPRTEGTLFPFRVWDGSKPLDEVDMPDLYRAFRVVIGASRTPRTNSNRDTTWLAAALEIHIGYPWYTINAKEASRAGIEAICAEDTSDIQIALCRKRLAALHTIGAVRSLIPESTRRGTRTQIIPFYLEWGQPNNA
jgi:hypothetical protein